MPPYCGGAAGCSAAGLQGASVSRTLSWTPEVNRDWVVPPGGFPVVFHVTQHPANPLDLSLTLPPRPYQFGPVYLDVQLPPEFVAPTPEPLGVRPVNMTGYLGEELTASIKVQQRNQEQQLDIVSAEDPGMPNEAVLSAPEERTASIVLPFTVIRKFIWVPQCSQAGKAKLSLAAINRQIHSLRAEKHFEFNIIQPHPMVVDFDASQRAVRVGCTMEIPVHAMDALNESNYRPSYNRNYLQIFTWSLSRNSLVSTSAFSLASASSFTYPQASAVLQGSNEGQEELPLNFPGVAVIEREPNEYRGMSARLRWTPKRGQEGRQYVVCVRVEDACKSGTPVVKCVNISVLKCQACLTSDDSLLSIAASYKTDFLSLYTTNIHLQSPDHIPPGTPVNTGLMYKVKEGDSMASIATRFFTTVEQLLDNNADLAARSGILTPFSPAGDVNLGPRQLWHSNLLTSEKLPADYSILIMPGDEVCVIPPVCDVRCDSGSTCTFAADNRASGGLLT
jgi:hypothetical protein